ncbi:hypothetical protein FB45DRAFT_825183, partial [Roridomyces roridus]
MSSEARSSTLLPSVADIQRVIELLRSNSEPPDHITSTISMLSDEVARLSEGPARPVAHNRRVPSDCTTYLYQCRSLLSPIRRMPPEIMAHLFDISSPRLRTTQYRYICFVPLLALSQVCASWRVIILGTPTLWRSISLSWHSDNASCTTKWLTVFLNRGAQCALHLKIFNVCPAV